jgi:hypothetical protein
MKSTNCEDPHYARFEVFTVVKIEVEVFWVVTPCSAVAGYQHFRGPCCLLLQDEVTDPEDGSSMIL